MGTVNKGGQGERIYCEDGVAITISASGGGVGARTGLYLINGKVQVIKNAEELLSGSEEGDVLVTSKTNGLMNSLIGKASAIITEDGNMIGHAVIM